MMATAVRCWRVTKLQVFLKPTETSIGDVRPVEDVEDEENKQRENQMKINLPNN